MQRNYGLAVLQPHQYRVNIEWECRCHAQLPPQAHMTGEEDGAELK